MRKLGILSFLVLALLSACRKGIEIPTEFPTPPPPASSTPLPKLELHTDAELEKKFAEIAEPAKGKVGAAAVVLETGDAAFLNADQHFPMQSVYKLPISMAVLEQARLDERDLDEEIGVTKEDMVRKGQASFIRDVEPEGGEWKIRQLIQHALIESDGTASDVLVKIAGGPNAIESYLAEIGIRDIRVVNTEKELGKDWQTQYDNWATPAAAVEMLRWLEAAERTVRESATPTPVPTGICNCPTIAQAHANLNDLRMIMGLMTDSTTGAKRLKGLLPEGTVVAHKTGTSGTQNGITAATNDIGLITLPNGRHLAIAVFVSDSPADERTREAVIAKIAKAGWDKFGS